MFAERRNIGFFFLFLLHSRVDSSRTLCTEPERRFGQNRIFVLDICGSGPMMFFLRVGENLSSGIERAYNVYKSMLDGTEETHESE